jgi:hypothetical protein
MTRRSTRLSGAAAVVAMLLLAFLPSQRPLAQTPVGEVVALTGARLFDGTGRPPLANATLLVSNGRVLASGPAAAVQIPASATRIDLRGKTIIPGLVNAHGHVQVEQGSALPVRDDLLRRLRMYAHYGVTTVVSLGSGRADEAPGIALRDEQRAGRADGSPARSGQRYHQRPIHQIPGREESGRRQRRNRLPAPPGNRAR